MNIGSHIVKKDVLSTNISHKVEEASAFECGNTFTPQNGLPVETKELCIGMYGKEVDFFSLKGVVETILNNVGLIMSELYDRLSPYFDMNELDYISLEGKVNDPRLINDLRKTLNDSTYLFVIQL